MDKPSKLERIKLSLEYDRTLRTIRADLRKRTIKN